MSKKNPIRHVMRVGVGEAIDRLIRITHLLGAGVANVPQHFIDERALLIEALNHIELDLAFDCDGDDNPDTVEIFQHSVTTSCCRILKLPEQRIRHRYWAADGSERTLTPGGRTMTPQGRTITPMPTPPESPSPPETPEFKPRGTVKPRKSKT